MAVIELSKNVKLRFDLSDICTLAKRNTLDANIATSETRTVTSIIPLACSFPSLVTSDEMDELAEEWLGLSHA